MSFYKPIDPHLIPKRPFYGRLQDLLCMFDHMNEKALELNWQAMGYARPDICQTSIAAAARRKGYPFKAIVRNDRVFLIKEE